MKTGARLRMARRRLRMTQKELAGDDFHRSLISQIETGLIEPSLQTLTTLADRMGLPASFFSESEGEELRAQVAIEEARAFVEKGAYSEAYNRLLDTLPVVSSFRWKALLLLQIGDILLLAERSGEALGYFAAAQRYLRLNEDAHGLVEALLQTGRAASHLRRYQDAISSYTEAVALLDRYIVPNDRQERHQMLARRVRLTLNIGRNWTRLKEFGRALDLLGEAASLATDAGLYEDLGLAHQTMAFIHKQCSEYAEALHHTKIALKCFDRPEHTLNRATCLLNLGNVFLADSQPEQAIPYYEEALAEANDDPKHTVMIYAGLATAYYYLQDYAKATLWSEKAVPILLANSPALNTLSQSDELTRVFLLLARIYNNESEQDESQQELRAELDWFNTRGFVEQAWQAMDPLLTLPN